MPQCTVLPPTLLLRMLLSLPFFLLLHTTPWPLSPLLFVQPVQFKGAKQRKAKITKTICGYIYIYINTITEKKKAIHSIVKTQNSSPKKKKIPYCREVNLVLNHKFCLLLIVETNETAANWSYCSTYSNNGTEEKKKWYCYTHTHTHYNNTEIKWLSAVAKTAYGWWQLARRAIC